MTDSNMTISQNKSLNELTLIKIYLVEVGKNVRPVSILYLCYLQRESIESLICVLYRMNRSIVATVYRNNRSIPYVPIVIWAEHPLSLILPCFKLGLLDPRVQGIYIYIYT